LQHATVLERGSEAAVSLAFDAGDVGIELQVHALLAQLVAQMLTHRAVKAAQEQIAAIQQRSPCAQAMEDRGELHGDIAAADHQYTLGQLLEEEGLVGADGVLATGNVRNLRPAAGGDENALGPVALAIDLDGMAIDDARMAFEQADATVGQQIAVDAVEALDLAVLVGDQRRPVEVRFAQRPAETCGLLEVLGEMRTVHQQFLRYAADVDAGAAQIATLGDRDAGTKASGEARRTYAAGTGADHEQIEVVTHFGYLLGRWGAYRKAQR